MPSTDSRHLVDLPADEIQRDVFGFLAKLRREHPIAYVTSLNAWVLTRWEDIHAVLASPEHFRAKPTYLYMPAVGGEYLSTVGDGETHQRLRRGVDASLAPRSVESWAGDVIDPAVSQRLDEIADRGRADLLDDVMGPIAMNVVTRVLGLDGLPPEEIWRWYDGLADGLTNFGADPARQDRSWALGKEIDARCRPLLRERFETPDDTMMSHLLANAEGESFGERFQFVMPTLKAALFAGGQEPAHATVNTLIGVLGDDDVRERFLADPYGLVEQAGEEGLRWLPPLMAFLRRVRADAVVGEVMLQAGDELMVSLASANRDESIWGADADRFDLDRFEPGSQQHHVSFGMHPHFCPGNWLVRTTMRRAIPLIVGRLVGLRLDPSQPVALGGNVLINAPHLHCVWNT
jgi:cytochrome P450